MPTPAPPPSKSWPRPLLWGFLVLASEIIGATLPGIALIDGKRGLSLCLDCELEFFDVALLVAVERVLRNDASTMDSPGLLALPAASAIDASTGIYNAVAVTQLCQQGAPLPSPQFTHDCKERCSRYISDARAASAVVTPSHSREARFARCAPCSFSPCRRSSQGQPQLVESGVPGLRCSVLSPTTSARC